MTPTSDYMPHLRETLEAYAQALLAAYRDNLLPHNAGGDLITTASARVEQPDGSTWLVVFNLQEYWKYIEDGTRPHWPPPGALIPWIRVKPILPRPDSRGRLPTEKQLDFLIRRKISRVGTEGSHDLERAEDQLRAEWLPKIQRAIIQDFAEETRVYIVEQFRELNPEPVEL